jgi:cyclopropane fatty-acyl-phospholipid synthase-like methyltransferase
MQTVNKSWFEIWFDSPFYHILYKNRDQNEANIFIDNLIKKLEIDYGKILDLACGKGRHAHYLAEKGFDVVGVDLAKNSIDFANTMYSLPNLEFYVHDMRESFRINYFNYILNLFTSIGYFNQLKENEAVFHSAYKMLQDGGYFLIDFMNAEKVIKNLVPREKKEMENIHFYIRRQVIDGKIIKNIKVEKENNIYIYKEEVQSLMPHHFHNFANNAGFMIVNEFGNYNFDKFNVKTSDRYILLLKKK